MKLHGNQARAGRRVAAVLLAGMAAVAPAACGSSGGGSGSLNAQQLLQETFSGSHTVKSGVLNFRLAFLPTGSSTLSGPIALSLTGPFQSRGSGNLPESSFTVGLDALGRKGQLGLISTGSAGYITLNGISYRLPASDFHKLASGFSSAGTSGGVGLSKLGIDPLHWVTNPSVVGTATVGGTSTTLIRAGVNVTALLNDLSTFLHKASSSAAGSRIPSTISSATRQKIASTVKNPTVNVWTGTSDHTLRRLQLSLRIPVSGQIATLLGGLSSAGINLTFGYSDLNQPQTISAPSNVKPFNQFQSKLQGVLSQVQGAGVGGLGSLGSGSSSSGSGVTGASGASGAKIQKYTHCIQSAGSDVSKMQKCAGLLNGSGG